MVDENNNIPPPSFSSASNMSEGMNIALKNLSYQLLKPGDEDEVTPPIPGMEDIKDFNNTINKLFQNVLLIAKTFKEKYSDTVDPVLMNRYQDNFLWLKNLALELHRLIAPSWAGKEGDPDAEILEIARSLGKSKNEVLEELPEGSVGKFEEMSGPDIDTNIPQYYKYVICPGKYDDKHDKAGQVCGELLNTRGNRKVRCPYCNTDLIVSEIKNKGDSENEGDSEKLKESIVELKDIHDKDNNEKLKESIVALKNIHDRKIGPD